jgi:hypothetical protein
MDDHRHDVGAEQARRCVKSRTLTPDVEAAMMSAAVALDAILKALDEPHNTVRATLRSAVTIGRSVGEVVVAACRIARFAAGRGAPHGGFD